MYTGVNYKCAFNVTTSSADDIETLAHHNSRLTTQMPPAHAPCLCLIARRPPQAEFFVQSRAAMDLADLPNENLPQK